MTLISSGIDKVRVFDLPIGIGSDGSYISQAGLALVKWYSSWDDKFYQVYVNGELAGVTVDQSQRQKVVHVSDVNNKAGRIEVFAVEPVHAHIDYGSQLDSSIGQSGRVKISLLRSQLLCADARFEVYFDNGTGTIDYENPLTDEPVRIWPNWQDKAGFGMSSFGRSDFGYDYSAAVGFGLGSFGNGDFGVDADIVEWTSESIAAGVYKFGVKVFDDSQNQSQVSEIEDVTVIPSAKPAVGLAINSYDKQTNQLVLNIS